MSSAEPGLIQPMFITHAGAQIYAVEFGEGQHTLVAQGGWAGSWELWAEPLTLLAKTWRTIAYDHRGTGVTLAPPESITFDTLVSDLFAVLDTLQIEQCILAAESAGVAVALGAALQQPERFEGLVLVDGLYERPAPNGTAPFVMGLRTQYEKTIEQFVEACVPPTEPNRAAICEWGKKILLRASPDAAIKLYESMDGIDLRPAVSNLGLPTLILHGAQDKIQPPSASEWLAAHMPNAQLQIIPDAGHVPTMTHPHLVAQAILSFFE